MTIEFWRHYAHHHEVVNGTNIGNSNYLGLNVFINQLKKQFKHESIIRLYIIWNFMWKVPLENYTKEYEKSLHVKSFEDCITEFHYFMFQRFGIDIKCTSNEIDISEVEFADICRRDYETLVRGSK
jgi:hypothetical protein